MNDPALAHLLWIIPLAVLTGYIGSPRFKGTMAQTRVRRLLDASLEPGRYRVLHSLVIPGGGGTVHVDHLVICRTAIFVIDSIYGRGWISGSRAQDRWKQEGWLRVQRFDNPVHQNDLRVDALSLVTGLSRLKFESVIVFNGHKGFRKGLPEHVTTMSRLVSKIRSPSEHRLTPEECNRAMLSIQEALLHGPKVSANMRWRILRWVLFLALVTGSYLAYNSQIHRAIGYLQKQADMAMDPSRFHPDGTEKTPREIWKETLNCAVSADTNRCACYEPGGRRAELAITECRELAEKGSILRQ